MITFLIINLILLIIYITILIAKTFLLNYGPCEITIKNEEKKITIEGGKNLLTVLKDNGFSIPSSCGGKATCGYCKCRIEKGGGELLPTENIFMSKDEKKLNTRLACQVKVKTNMEIIIPDFFETVKTMVKDKTYDSSLKWEFTIKNNSIIFEEQTYHNKKLSLLNIKNINDIITTFNHDKSQLLPILHQINTEFKYFSENIIIEIAKELDIPISQIIKFLTSYNAFSTIPVGKNIIKVCTGTSCYLKGSYNIIKQLSSDLKVEPEKTTKDMKFTLNTVRCLGICSSSPAIMINEKVYGNVKLSEITKIIKDYS